MKTKIAASFCAAGIGIGLLTGCEGGVLGELERMGQDSYEQTHEHSGPSRIEAEIIRVIDGDTVVVASGSDLPANTSRGGEHSVRVLGIDTPEMDWNTGNHECGAEATTQIVKDALPAGTQVTLVYDQVADRFDRFDRSLAYVEVSGIDIGDKLTSEGYAAAWYPSSAPEPSRFSQYDSNASEAMAEGRGAWGTCSSMGR